MNFNLKNGNSKQKKTPTVRLIFYSLLVPDTLWGHGHGHTHTLGPQGERNVSGPVALAPTCHSVLLSSVVGRSVPVGTS